MRCKAKEVLIPQPKFVSLFNYEVLDEFMKRTSSPWMLKPRIGASSMGIKKLHDPETVWRAIADLDAREPFHERSAFHLLEQFLHGDVYHVDSLVAGSRVLFASVERYGAPPFEVSHSGGVPISYFVKHGSQDQRALLKLNKKLLNGFGFEQGVTHAEFIRRADSEHESDQFLFLEVAARVGGAYTADTIAAATGINLWCEWAKIELATPERPYILVLHDVEGHEHGEIARMLGVAEGTSKSQLHKARMKLRRLLREQAVGSLASPVSLPVKPTA